MTCSSPPRLLSTASLGSETEDDVVIVSSQSSHIEQELTAPAHRAKAELLSWFRHHKRSAGFHLKQYLHFKELWDQESKASATQSSSKTGALVLKDYSSTHGENYWNMKVEKDFLVSDLTAMGNILGELSITFGPRQWTETLGMLVAASLCGLFSLIPTIGGGFSAAAAAMSSLSLAYDPVKHLVYNGIIRRYKSKTLSIKDSAETERLEKGVMMPRFDLLSWMS